MKILLIFGCVYLMGSGLAITGYAYSFLMELIKP